MKLPFPTLSRDPIGDRACIPVLVLAVFAYYGRLLTGHVLYASDMLCYALGQKLLIRDALCAGRLAVYDASVLCGCPLLENITAGVLYPLNALLVLGSSVWAAHLFVFVHYLLGALFFYAFLRRGVTLPGWASASGAFAYCAGGYAWCMADHLFFPCLPWVPLFLLALVRMERHRLWLLQRRWAALAAFSLVMLFLCGNFQQAYDTVLLGGVWVAICSWPAIRSHAWHEALQRGGLYAGVVAVAALIAAPQLAPTLLGALRGHRGWAMPLSAVQAMSFPPFRLLELVFPFLFGVRDGYGSALRAFYGGDFPWAQSVFIGIPVVAGAVVTVHRRQSRMVWWLWGLVVVGLLLAVGRYLPIYRLAHAIVPGFGVFRHPEKYIFWVHTGLAALGAVGLSQGEEREGAIRLLWAFGAIAALVLVICLAVVGWATVGNASFADALARGGVRLGAGTFLAGRIVQGIGALCAATIAGGVVVWLLCRKASGHAFGVSLCLVTVLHVLFVSHAMRWTIPREWLSNTETAATRLPATERGGYRIFSDDTKRSPSEAGRGHPPFVEQKLREYARLSYNAASLAGARSLGGYSPLARQDFIDFIDFRRHSPPLVMDVAAARFIILDGLLRPEQLPPGNELFHVDESLKYTILANPFAYPRIHAANAHLLCTDNRAGPAETALSLAQARRQGDARGALPPVALAELPDNYVACDLERDPDLVVETDLPGRVELACTGPTWIVVREWSHPGWRAVLDERDPVDIVRADGHFMALFVPVGRHSVSLTYSAPGLLMGCILAVAGALLGAVLWVDPLVLLDPLS